MCFVKPKRFLKKTTQTGCQHFKTRRFHRKTQISGFAIKNLETRHTGFTLPCDSNWPELSRGGPFRWRALAPHATVPTALRLAAHCWTVPAGSWTEDARCIVCLFRSAAVPAQKRGRHTASERRPRGAVAASWAGGCGWAAGGAGVLTTVFKGNKREEPEVMGPSGSEADLASV